MPGLCSIIRAAISSVGRPASPAPRRMRSTLYCCSVIPWGSTTAESAVRNLSAVRSSVTTASSAGDANGLVCLISSFTVPIA